MSILNARGSSFHLVSMKREDLISAHTRSKARLPGTEGEAEGDGAQGEDIAAEGNDIEDEIDQFTLGPKDMQASPSQTQPQGQPHD